MHSRAPGLRLGTLEFLLEPSIFGCDNASDGTGRAAAEMGGAETGGRFPTVEGGPIFCFNAGMLAAGGTKTAMAAFAGGAVGPMRPIALACLFCCTGGTGGCDA